MSGAELARAMALLAAEHRAASAPGDLERAVMAPVAIAATAAPSETVRRSRPRKRAAVPRPSSVEEPFITVPYTVPLAPEENVTVVRMTISPSAMAGFPLPEIDPGSGMQADVLVGEDGRARAIRIVASSSLR
jgi:hypothetical protein